MSKKSNKRLKKFLEFGVFIECNEKYILKSLINLEIIEKAINKFIRS
jgi:hypothetical protein